MNYIKPNYAGDTHDFMGAHRVWVALMVKLGKPVKPSRYDSKW